MKKALIVFLTFLFLVGCTVATTSSSPTKVVERLLGKYQSLNEEVIKQLNQVLDSQNITKEQKKEYRDLMKKQYQNLTYNIKKETIDDETAVVSVEIEVFNFAKANNETEVYVSGHEEDFLDDNNQLSDVLYQNYKIDQLKNVKERTKYTLDLSLTKEDDIWKLDELSDMERQKIHGLYDL